MDPNILGIILSYLFVFSVIAISTLLQLSFKLPADFSRKIIHITVGNWVFVAMYYFNDWKLATLVPASFILINYLSYRFELIKAMELEEKNPGTVYYSISLTILTLLTFIKPNFYLLPYLGILVMTWGDGFAAIIGKKIPIKEIRHNRSVGGTVAFILFSFCACSIYLFTQQFPVSGLLIILIAGFFSLMGAIVELFTPRNLDNLTVPLVTGLIGIVVESFIV